MRAKITMATAIFMLLNATLGFSSDGLPNDPYILITGKAKTFVKPDGVKITSVVSGRGRTAAHARRDVDERVNAAMGVLREFELDDGDVEIFSLNVNEDVDYKNGEYQTLGYEAVRDLTFTIRDLARAGDILDQLLQVNIAEVTDVEPILDNRNEVEDQVLQKAFRNAERRANLMAQLSERTLGPVYSLDNDRYRYSRLERVQVTGSRISPDKVIPVIQLNEFEISQDITVVFLLK